MIAIPAVDLREGACVQLVGGSLADERVRLPDPPAVARRWASLGFRHLHVVDLDAAMGTGCNAQTIDAILVEASVKTQVGGGVRSSDEARRLFDAGAARVVVGTRAIDDPEWLAELSEGHPGRVVVAADVRGREVVTDGWVRSSQRDVLDLVRSLAALRLAGLLVTAVHAEGLMRGTDLALMQAVVDTSEVPVIASGGVTTLEDLRALGRIGVTGAVIGMALYTGVLDARATAEEFGG